MDRAALGELYRSESRDYLDALSRAILALERGEGRDAVDEAFRVVHTLKGMSAAMGYQAVTTLAHGVEHMLDRVRSGALEVDEAMVDALSQAVDQLELVIDESWKADAEAGFATPGQAARGAWAPAKDDSQAEASGGSRFVRVEQDRIDRLVDRVGELIVSRERLLAAAHDSSDAGVRRAAEQLGREIAELRDDVFQLRLAPVAEVFERLHRLVRDTARGLKKDVRLETRGVHVELDRALIGDLADLLTHLIRNAIDHGIESREERIAAGKDPSGTVRVSATSDPDTVAVRVEDDGRGIDLDGVARHAAAAGLRDAGAGSDLAADELFDLLTRPGFSTARRVTEVSGRGVGLDRVASRLRELGGNLDIESEPGRGAAFTLRLPKTLSLTRVLLVNCEGETLAIPASAVERVEELDAPTTALTGRGDGASRAVDLGAILGLRDEPPAGSRSIVVLSGAGRRQDLLVDTLIGLRDFVVKRFAVPRRVRDLYAGAAILPDGRPCLVLQPARLLSNIPASSGTTPYAGAASP